MADTVVAAEAVWPPKPLVYRHPEECPEEGSEVVELAHPAQTAEEGWAWGSGVTAAEVNELREYAEMAYRVVALGQDDERAELMDWLRHRFEQ